MRARAVALAILLGASSIGCSSAGSFVWYHDLPRTEWGLQPAEYVIGVGDVIGVHAYDGENINVQAKIRSDGRIAVPFVGEIVAAGKHPSALAQEIEQRLKQFVVAPHIIVNVEQSEPVRISVLGEAGHVGSLTLEPGASLLQALAMAGGTTDYADRSRIFVLRWFPEFRRIRFTYDALLRNEGGAATFPMRSGDVIVIE